MRIQINSSGTSHIKPSRYSSVLNYSIEYLVMILIAASMVGTITGSHLIGLPLYKINPMHWVIYIIILFRKPFFSSVVVLAFALPFTSYLLTGHPFLFKSIIMGAELAVYGIIFIATIKTFHLAPVLAFVVSQVSGHIFYYGLKFVLIKVGLIDSVLVSTSIILQLVVFAVLGLFVFLTDKIILTDKHRN